VPLEPFLWERFHRAAELERNVASGPVVQSSGVVPV
jgi:hypothetical protein